jgi:hypothetical protein
MSGIARQEVLNVHLAILLSKLGLEARAERKKGRIPDITLRHPRLGLIIGEAEVGEDVTDSSARAKLENRAQSRFGDPKFSGIDLILLFIYTRELVERVSQAEEVKVGELLADSEIGLGLAMRPQESTSKPKIGWYHAPVRLAQAPRAVEELAAEFMRGRLRPDEVADTFSTLIEQAPDRLPRGKEWDKLWKEKARHLEIPVESLKWEDAFTLFAKTFATLATTCLIIYELARARFPNRLKPIYPMSVSALTEALMHLSKINYVEAIDLVLHVLEQTPSHSDLDNYLSRVYDEVKRGLPAIRVSGWEVLAYIYQRFLSERFRKAYATFYTKYPAAILLASLSIESERESVADPAMGSGSLLLASLYKRVWLGLGSETIYEMAEKSAEQSVLDVLYKEILGKTAGLDALRASTALSSSMLTIASLAVERDPLKLYHVPVGSNSSGSLELLDRRQAVLFEDARQAFRGRFDVILMNPPFTRSDRISLEYIGEDAKKRLLKNRLRFGGEPLGDIFTAGMAKPFLALADKLSKKTIGCVLPNSILSREAWADIRRGLLNAYTLNYIVTSWAKGTPNFSSDTQFREILLVARKGVDNSAPLKIINLIEKIDDLDPGGASLLAHQAKEASSTVTLTLAGKKPVAEVVVVDQTLVRHVSDNLYRLIAFRDKDLLQLHLAVLSKSKRLGDICDIGSVVDHTEGLSEPLQRPPRVSRYYPVAWGSGENLGIRSPFGERPGSYIYVTDEESTKIKFWDSDEYWSTLFMLRRGQLNTQYLLMFELSRRAVSNVWWPLRPRGNYERHVPQLLCYMNSSLGYLLMLGERQETRGLYVEYKKGFLNNFRIPLLEAQHEATELREDLKQAMPTNFGTYIKKMSELESQLGSTVGAINAALEISELAPRARLDARALSFLESLGIDAVKICGNQLYRKLLFEQETLLQIMESSEEKPKLPKEAKKSVGEMVGQSKMTQFLSQESQPNDYNRPYASATAA